MVYEYEEPTSFFPTMSTKVVTDPAQYKPWEGSLEEIRFPQMFAEQVVKTAKVVLNKDLLDLSS